MATENYTLGRGELYFSRFKTGTFVPEGFRFMGNCPTFNISATVNKLEHYRSTRGTKEKDLTIPIETNRSAKISAEDVSPENLALFFLGTNVTQSQASATGLTESFVGVIKGRIYQVGLSDSHPAGYHSLTTPVLSKASTPLVLGTDYTIDTDRGTFVLLSTGTTVVNGDTLSLAFGVAAKSRDAVISGSAAVKGALKFVAYPAEGKPIDYYLPYVEASPDGDLQLIGDQLVTVGMSLDIYTQQNQEAIYANGLPYTPGS